MKCVATYLMCAVVAVISLFLFSVLPQDEALAADDGFSVFYSLTPGVDDGNGARTRDINLDIHNVTGEPVRNLTITMLSPFLPPKDGKGFSVGKIGIDGVASLSGSFTTTDAEMDDERLITYLVWVVRYDDASGARHERYVDGFYQWFASEQVFDSCRPDG